VTLDGRRITYYMSLLIGFVRLFVHFL